VIGHGGRDQPFPLGFQAAVLDRLVEQLQDMADGERLALPESPVGVAGGAEGVAALGHDQFLGPQGDHLLKEGALDIVEIFFNTGKKSQIGGVPLLGADGVVEAGRVKDF